MSLSPENSERNSHGKQRSSKHLPTGGLIHELHDFFLDAGVNAERSGETQMALDLYEQAVQNKPDSALAWYNYGDALLAMTRLDEAVSALRKSVELSPKTNLFHYDLGLALYELDRHDEAGREFAPIVACDPHLKRASSDLFLSSMTNLALCQDELGRPEEAVRVLSPARAKVVNLLYNLGRLNYRAKRLADALPLAQAAVLLTPKSEEVVHLLGCILIDLKREREALEILHRATKLDPKCAYAWYDLGVTLARLKQRRKARLCFQKTLRLAPNYPWTYYDLACLDALERRREAAFVNLELAIAYGLRGAEKLRRDTDLRSLRHDARWKTILQRVGDSSK
jgi:tetratricopeptide (TPR) repeat protein